MKHIPLVSEEMPVDSCDRGVSELLSLLLLRPRIQDLRVFGIWI